MSPEDLRELLEQVEVYGGPRIPERYFGFYPIVSDMQPDAAHDLIVAALKRDLIERWYGLNSNYSPKLSPTWRCEIYAYSERQVTRVVAEQHGDSELEAVLRAWLATAKAEGWTA